MPRMRAIVEHPMISSTTTGYAGMRTSGVALSLDWWVLIGHHRQLSKRDVPMTRWRLRTLRLSLTRLSKRTRTSRWCGGSSMLSVRDPLAFWMRDVELGA